MVNPGSFARSGLGRWTPPDPLSESEIIIVLRRSEQSELVGLIAGAQRQLYAYILTLVADRDQADDVLQETNLVLWEKSNDYTPGTSFMA